MSCENCTNHVKTALEEVGGVKYVHVDLEEKNAVVEFTHNVENSELKKAIELEAGYELAKVENV